MKLCQYCQKEVFDSAVKCRHCGGWFTNDAEATQAKIDRDEQLEKVIENKKDIAAQDFNVATQYFSLPNKKFIILSLLTAGFYEFVWFYKNWKAVKIQENKKILPFWRAVFSVFFCYSLLKRIFLSAQQHGYKPTQSYQTLTVFYIAITMLHKAPDPFGWLTILTFIPLLTVMDAIRFQNRSVNSEFQEVAAWTKGEWFMVFGGLILWGLVAVGYFFPGGE